MTTYKESGVDIQKGDMFVKSISERVKQTWTPEVKSELGDFAALYSLLGYEMKHPVLVTSTDGVGTKLKIATTMGIHDTVGIDLVAMCVNDVLVKGARPLFFLDYFACGKLEPKTAAKVVEGIVQGCKEAGCALVGGETAEMPGMYEEGEYDLAGFVVGIVDDEATVDGTDISEGDVVVGVASSGLHSNGFSLVRKIVSDSSSIDYDMYIDELQTTLGEALLVPTKIYAKAVMNLVRDFDIKGMAHITGGGIQGNCRRILPGSAAMRIQRGAWHRPPIFDLIQKYGKLSEEELFKTFNCGIGLVLVVSPDISEEVMLRLKGLGEKAFIIGEIVHREEGAPPLVWV